MVVVAVCHTDDRTRYLDKKQSLPKINYKRIGIPCQINPRRSEIVSSNKAGKYKSRQNMSIRISSLTQGANELNQNNVFRPTATQGPSGQHPHKKIYLTSQIWVRTKLGTKSLSVNDFIFHVRMCILLHIYSCCVDH